MLFYWRVEALHTGRGPREGQNMPRVPSARPKPGVVRQTIEVRATQPAARQEPKKSRPDFWTYIGKLTLEEWKDHVVYLTRELPKLHTKGIGRYLVKIVEPFDIDDIKNAYGGFEFSYIMKRKNAIVYCGRFRIEAPPKLDTARESQPIGESGTNVLLYQLVSMLREELARSREANKRSTATGNQN
jgi:hypothetical protein